jgi:formate hydrogenlyase subunit 3/multisubunit Na+/H+ antiporter MnhD subunit
MLSRIGRVIDRNRERIGMILFIIGVFWMMGVAGADDFNTMQHVFNPVLPLVVKSLIGLLIAGIGVKILNGGE